MHHTLAHGLTPGNPPAEQAPRPTVRSMPAGQMHTFVNDATVETAEKMARVVEMRRKRMHWRDIGAAMGFEGSYAKKLYDRALASIPASQVDEHRAEETMLIDDATRNLLEIATDEKVSHRSRIEAWSVIRAWAERKAKLLGLDAPTQTVSIDKIDAEIMALSRELESLAKLGEEAEPEPKSTVQRGGLGVKS
jgi:hypothetical protein